MSARLDMNLIGQTLGSIRVEALLGRGGMGEVYRGFDLKLERQVALKVLLGGQRFSTESRARLLREARILSRLGHAAICQIHDIADTPRGEALVLEFVAGQTLREHLRLRDCDTARLLAVLRTTSEALAAAHHERIVHRDLKPDNVMMTPSGQVKVLDFGIARVAMDGGAEPMTPGGAPLFVAPLNPGEEAPTQAYHVPVLTPSSMGEQITEVGVVLGTRRYMSPEQVSGHEVGPASDVFALGVVFEEAMDAASDRGARDPLLQAEIDQLIDRMRRVDAERRPSADEVKRAFDLLLDFPARRARLRFRRILLAGGVVALTATLATVSYFAWQARAASERAERRRAQAEQLVDFMMGDLRSRLQTIGKLEVLQAVNERAIEYFAAVPAEELGESELLIRVRSLWQIVDVMRRTGRFADADEIIGTAERLSQTLLARRPDDAEVIAHVAETRSWRGYFQREVNADPAAAAETFAAAAADYQHADQLAPGAGYASNVASAFNNLGSLMHLRGQFDVARGHLATSAEAWRRILAENPGDRDALAKLATVLGWASSNEQSVGDLARAIAIRKEQADILRTLRDGDPENALHREDLAIALRYQAELEAWMGRVEAAEAMWGEGLAIAQALAGADAANTDYQRLVGIYLASRGHERLRRRDHADAASDLSAALAQFSALLQFDDAQREWRRWRAVARIGLAELALLRREDSAAQGELAGARDALDRLIDEDSEDRESRRWRAELALIQSGLDQARGSAQAARSALSLGRELIGRETASSSDFGAIRLALRIAEAADDEVEAGLLRARLDALVATRP